MRSSIKSAANPKIKLAISLHQKKHREKAGMFLVEGIRMVEMAIRSGWEIEYGFFTMEAARESRVAAALLDLDPVCNMYEVSTLLLQRIGETQTPQGIVLVVKFGATEVDMKTILGKEKPLLVALESVQDPGNVGTIIRTADAVGADGVVLLGNSVDPFCSKALRATMGSIFHVPVITALTKGDFLRELDAYGIPLFAAAIDMSAGTFFHQDFSEASAIIFGNEANGLSDDILARSKSIYIPMQGHAESFNVAVAAGIIMYEAFRQRL
ncbi:MAG: RNA methyltransferase [Selenomonadaceae bacterium]|nr:RNA methyltransferase [Selenomonadaceae bacterium]